MRFLCSTQNHEYRIESILETLSKSEEGVGRLIEVRKFAVYIVAVTTKRQISRFFLSKMSYFRCFGWLFLRTEKKRLFVLTSTITFTP